MSRHKAVEKAVVVSAIVVVSLLHYETSTHHLWLHALFQRAYYLPVLLAALWFGWRGGILAAALAGALYVPHILHAWATHMEYSAYQYIEVPMFFVTGGLTGVLADQEKRQRSRVEKTAKELSEVYAQLQASFEQLRRADRLSALGQLSAGLAHEIRNPLSSVQGAIQILSRPDMSEATRVEFSELAQKETNRLNGLLSNFLEFARPAAPHRVPTQLPALFESVRTLSAHIAKMAGVRIQIELPDDLPAVPLDPEQMKQVLLNLVINAIQAMPAGGEVLLRGERQSNVVTFRVQDQGIGINPEHLEKIFDPFFTTRTDGTGLGLSIAYQIIGRHGGHLEARANPERGMTFMFALPLLSEEHEVELNVQAKAVAR